MKVIDMDKEEVVKQKGYRLIIPGSLYSKLIDVCAKRKKEGKKGYLRDVILETLFEKYGRE